MTEIKEAVRQRYGQAALRAGSCCGTPALEGASPITSILYSDRETGELREAAVLASLGCGNPTDSDFGAVVHLHPFMRSSGLTDPNSVLISSTLEGLRLSPIPREISSWNRSEIPAAALTISGRASTKSCNTAGSRAAEDV